MERLVFMGWVIPCTNKWEDLGEGAVISRNWATTHFLTFHSWLWSCCGPCGCVSADVLQWAYDEAWHLLRVKSSTILRQSWWPRCLCHKKNLMRDNMIGKKWIYLERYSFHRQNAVSGGESGPRVWDPLRKWEWLWEEFFFFLNHTLNGCVIVLKVVPCPPSSCFSLTALAERELGNSYSDLFGLPHSYQLLGLSLPNLQRVYLALSAQGRVERLASRSSRGTRDYLTRLG